MTQVETLLKDNKLISDDGIYKIIRERICVGDYPPGDILSEQVLANEFKRSRTPIRKVIQRLEHEQFVTVKHGIGTIITPVNLRSIKQIYTLRMKLAEMIGELPPVANPQQEHIESLEQLLAQIQDLREVEDVRRLAQFNIAMHDVRQPLIGNEELRRIFDALYYRTGRVWLQVLPDLDYLDEVNFMVDEINQTIQALHAKDMCAVGLIRRNSISLALGRIIHYLSSAGGQV